MLSYMLCKGKEEKRGGHGNTVQIWFQRLSGILVRMMLQSKFAVGLAA